MGGGSLGRFGLLGRKRQALPLFGTRRREVDLVDRVLARKVVSLTDATSFCWSTEVTDMYFELGAKFHLLPCKSLTPGVLGPALRGSRAVNVIQAAPRHICWLQTMLDLSSRSKESAHVTSRS